MDVSFERNLYADIVQTLWVLVEAGHEIRTVELGVHRRGKVWISLPSESLYLER